MTDIPVPPEAVTVAHDILWGGQMSEALVRRALEVAAPCIRARHPDGLDPAELAATLAAMIADLDGYITRKAEVIAAPVIAAAQEAALEPAAEAQADAQRWKDVNTELGRRIAALQRNLDASRRYREIAEGLPPGTLAPQADGSPDVHVDWHMTPAEWAELREALLRNPDGPYIARLIAEGKVGA